MSTASSMQPGNRNAVWGRRQGRTVSFLKNPGYSDRGALGVVGVRLCMVSPSPDTFEKLNLDLSSLRFEWSHTGTTPFFAWLSVRLVVKFGMGDEVL